MNDPRIRVRGFALALFAATALTGGCALFQDGTESASTPAASSASAAAPASAATRSVTGGGVAAATPPPATPAAPVAQPPASPPQAAAPAAPPPPPIMSIDEAINFAARNLFANAPLAADAPQPVVIDPLIDGNSGVRSVATQAMGLRVANIVKSNFPKFEMQPFNTGSLARAPYLFIGTFTPVDAKGANAGPREWYRICFALVDLRSGKIVSKGFARANPGGVDHTPTAFFQDVPAWVPDAATGGYVRTCQGTKVGDSIKPEYWDKIVASALINDAINAYEAGRYEEAFDLYRGVQRTGGGDQLRVYNGLYLSSWKLGRQSDAAEAFGKIVDYGLTNKRLAVKFLFRPGSTLFWDDPKVSGPYGIWLNQISRRASATPTCLEVAGHSSRTGPEPVNVRLSTLRAEQVRQRLSADAKVLAQRISAVGKGSSENISGLGTDDARDALDRRVEFKVVDCKTA